jgi:hypothetical protein
VTVVSGLPRSGTSMMMRMLEAGGMTTMTDGIREADQDNPRGYYEYEPVKRLKMDTSWLELAGGKAVKMVCRLLTDLPSQWNYRIIFMRRNMSEILASQRIMLTRIGNSSATPDSVMADLLEKELSQVNSWIRSCDNFRTVEVSYNDLVVDPLPICARINEFLGGTLNCDRMAAVVDPGLYRQRVA